MCKCGCSDSTTCRCTSLAETTVPRPAPTQGFPIVRVGGARRELIEPQFPIVRVAQSFGTSPLQAQHGPGGSGGVTPVNDTTPYPIKWYPGQGPDNSNTLRFILFDQVIATVSTDTPTMVLRGQLGSLPNIALNNANSPLGLKANT